jgi:hypothetical protein
MRQFYKSETSLSINIVMGVQQGQEVAVRVLLPKIFIQ